MVKNVSIIRNTPICSVPRNRSLNQTDFVPSIIGYDLCGIPDWLKVDLGRAILAWRKKRDKVTYKVDDIIKSFLLPPIYFSIY